MFQYKTRGNSSPQGKQRVYFTCHPGDFETYFEKLSDQILALENCAVWYSYPEEAYQDIETDLGQMNLFVIPVTTKMLTTPNRTMDIDFPFALNRNIPVLPLMQENGLDELFCKRFGDLQYLNENAKDDTAIPYEEKLKRYLSSVLVGDELAAKVRAAFDAYIFLSYRKKDRKYAQELMRLIHKNDFCRDIAIWYDEFLTPGENFNSAIADALQKSELFALVVTPNLVNETNYVQSTEYPMARNSGKKILPAELENTDKSKLVEMYESIPECIDANDDKLLSQSLLECLNEIAMRENDSDPQHNFFIGIAYLNGIDVETDTERAVALITASAEAGLNEAIEKLVSMYQNGEGVNRDYRNAIEWQQKLVENFRNAYLRSGSVSDCKSLIMALWRLGDYLYNVCDFAAAESAYAEMERSCIELREHGVVSHRTLTASYNGLGDIRRSLGDLAGAEKYYEKALELSEELVKEKGTAASRRDLSLSYNNLGNIRKACGDHYGAEEYYKKSLALREELAKETGTDTSRRDLSISYCMIGDIRSALGDPAVAEEYYKKSLSLREELVKETGTATSRRDLSISYERLGDIRKAFIDYSGAEEYYKKALELSEAIAKETGTIGSRRGVTIGCNKLGDIRMALDDHAGAGEYYKKSLSLREELAKEAGTVGARRDLSVSYNNCGDVCIALGDHAGAGEYYKKSLSLREELTKETVTVDSRRDLSISYEKLGDICAALGDISKVEEYYKKALEICEEIAKETGTVESYDDIAILYYKCATVKDTPDTALLKKALDIYETLAKRCPDMIRYKKYREMIACILRRYS